MDLNCVLCTVHTEQFRCNLIASLLQRNLGLVKFVVGEVTFGRESLCVRRFSLASTFLPIILTDNYLNIALIRNKSGLMHGSFKEIDTN